MLHLFSPGCRSVLTGNRSAQTSALKHGRPKLTNDQMNKVVAAAGAMPRAT